MTSKLKRFDVSPEILENLLHLPDGSKIINIYKENNFCRGGWTFVIENENFDELEDGHLIPKMYCEISRTWDEDFTNEVQEWHWKDE